MDNTLCDAVEMRAQLNGLFEAAQARALEDDCVNRANGSARNPVSVEALSFVPSNPPTAAELQQVIDKLNELLAALKHP